MKKIGTLTLFIALALTMVFATALVAPVAAEDSFQILTGKVTEAGTLVADNGEKYTLSGEMAGELKKNVDKKVEIQGTIMGKPGEMSIQVQSFKLIEEPAIEQIPAQAPAQKKAE